MSRQTAAAKRKRKKKKAKSPGPDAADDDDPAEDLSLETSHPLDHAELPTHVASHEESGAEQQSSAAPTRQHSESSIAVTESPSIPDDERGAPEVSPATAAMLQVRRPGLLHAHFAIQPLVHLLTATAIEAHQEA